MEPDLNPPDNKPVGAALWLPTESGKTFYLHQIGVPAECKCLTCKQRIIVNVILAQ